MEGSEQSDDKKDGDKDSSRSDNETSQESPTKNGKIRRSLESMQEQMKVTDEEINYRTEMLENADSVKDHFKCTNCNLNFQSSKNKNKTISVHPLLGVLMCDDCCDYYGDGNFSLDSDGDDKYCRWCGEGGTLFECSKCICGFCDKCIKKHFGKDVLSKVENDDDWVCYICNPKPLWYLRSVCVIAKESVKSRKEQQVKRKRESDVKSKKSSKGKEDVLNKESNDESSSKSSSDISSDFQAKRKKRKIVKHRETSKRGDSSSSEEKPSKKSKSKNRSSREGSSLSEEIINPKKRQKMSSPASIQGRRDKKREKEEGKENESEKKTEEERIDFDAKKCLVLEKLRGIWKLTESITEVGLISSKERLNKLTNPDYLKSMEDLEKEYRKLRSFLMGLSSTFKIACNSVASVKLDLSFEKAKEERNGFQVEELELKKLAKALEDDSEVEAEANDSNGTKSNGKIPQSSSFSPSSLSSSSSSSSSSPSSSPSKTKDAKEVTNDVVNGKSPSVEAEILLSDGETRNDEEQNDENPGDENNKDDKSVTNEAVKPMLKVKSFAKMMEDNVLDTCDSKAEEEKKDSNQADDYNAETEGSTDDEKKGGNKKKQQKKKKKAESSGSNFSDETEESTRAALRRVKRDKATKKKSFERFKEVREKYLRSKAGTGEENKKTEKSGVLALSDNEESTVKSPKKRKKRNMILGSSDEDKKVTSEDKSDGEASDNKSSDEKVKEQSSSSQEKSSRKSSTSETSTDETAKQNKRRRRRTRKRRGNSSNESSDQDKDEEKKQKGGRKNINKILKKDSLQMETKEALKKEEERRKRVEERNKLYEKLFPDKRDTDSELPKEVILDFDPETKEPLVSVHKKLVKKLKPHQVQGVKFMWDNCFESVKRLEEDHGTGCILAHCMGLGKTLQVVTLVHTLMTHDIGVNTVLIVCPLSTVNNWINEFEMWLGNIKTEPIILYNIIKYKKMEERHYHLENWHKTGGVLVISYDLFRTLTKEQATKGRKGGRTKKKKVFEETLLDPGPDIVICDEGHLLKNEDTALSKCINRIKTSRRIVLTGTPLQNNLMEYHCMVQFVKPNILGTKKEFSNRFVNPINNGQFEDSTELDVKVMKRRSHVLHSMLSGCVQRFDYSVLTPFLPEKHEYVISISLTDAQAQVYKTFINNYSAKATGTTKAATLFNDYHNLQRIWTHPRTMLMHSKKESMKDVEDDSEGSLKDFVVSDDEEDEESTAGSSDSSSSSLKEVQPKKRILRSNANDPDVMKTMEEEEKASARQWWDEFFKESDYEDIRASNKLLILFGLLQRCSEAKDKVLVFSQSLYSLDLIEYFLNKIDEACDKPENELLAGYKDRWVHGLDYFRMDGSTNSDTRTLWCKHFNKESNTRARLFLISTRAGGLGINLFAANRVVIFDASWNPSHDVQSIFRVYRFGQKKTCYIYRFLAEATMEEKIYERQVTKLSLAHRVVDEHQIERHYSMMNLQELYNYEPTPESQRKVPLLPKDKIFADLLSANKKIIVGYHEHDSLLENQQEEELSEEERKAAWKEYEEEKENKGFLMMDAAELQRRLQMQGIIPQSSQMGHMPYFSHMSQTSQGQTFQMGATSALRFITPTNLTPNQAVMVQGYVNPVNAVYANPSIPMQMLHGGPQLAANPLFNGSSESYINRIKNQESWLQMGQGPRET